MLNGARNGRLKGLAAGGPSADARALAAAVLAARRKASPVDSMTFTPDLVLTGCQPANDLLANYRDMLPRYRAFLAAALTDRNR